MGGLVPFSYSHSKGSSCSGKPSTPFLYTENFYLAFAPNVNVTSSGKPAWTLPDGISCCPVLCFCNSSCVPLTQQQ